MYSIKILNTSWNGRVVYLIEDNMPMLGYIAFGIIDRGTNVLQVRPTTICPLNCIFCSVDSGPYSRHRWAEYIVKPKPLIDTMDYIASIKGYGLEALIDTIGDPLTYPWLETLVKNLKKIPEVSYVALETHGALLTIELVERLEKAGLDRINLSIDTLDKEKAKYLLGSPWFNIERVVKVAEYIVKNTSIDLHVTPLWIPGINDKDVIEVVEWAVSIGAGKKWPPVTIQKYNIHKYGRKVPGIKPMSWNTFWNKIAELEEKLGIKLRWSMDEWGMNYRKRVPNPVKKGDVVEVVVVARGWLKGEYLGVFKKNEEERLTAIVGYRGKIGGRILGKIIDDKDGLFITRFLEKL